MPPQAATRQPRPGTFGSRRGSSAGTRPDRAHRGVPNSRVPTSPGSRLARLSARGDSTEVRPVPAWRLLTHGPGVSPCQSGRELMTVSGTLGNCAEFVVAKAGWALASGHKALSASSDAVFARHSSDSLSVMSPPAHDPRGARCTPPIYSDGPMRGLEPPRSSQRVPGRGGRWREVASLHGYPPSRRMPQRFGFGRMGHTSDTRQGQRGRPPRTVRRVTRNPLRREA